MLRPKVIIQKLYKDSNKSIRIKPSNFSSSETRKGISAKIETFDRRYDVNVGDYLSINVYYENIDESLTYFPIMRVISVNINSENIMTIDAIDEFSYICKYTSFIPVAPTSNQQKFLKEFLGVVYSNDKENAKISDITIGQMIGYIQSIILPLSFNYSSKVSDSISYRNDVLFTWPSLKDDKLSAQSNIGKWQIKDCVSISAVIDKLRSNYCYDIFAFTSSLNFNIKDKPEDMTASTYTGYALTDVSYVLIVGLDAAAADINVNKNFTIVDNVNMINNDLIYIDVISEGKACVGIFTKKADKEKKTKESTSYYWAYFDKNGKINVSITDSLKINDKLKDRIKFFDTFELNDAGTFTEDQLKSLVSNKLLSNSYTGFTGSLTCFNENFNIYDRVSLYFYNNSADEINSSAYKNNEYEYAIQQIDRNYDESGLFMTTTLRQQLMKVSNKWINFNRK